MNFLLKLILIILNPLLCQKMLVLNLFITIGNHPKIKKYIIKYIKKNMKKNI